MRTATALSSEIGRPENCQKALPVYPLPQYPRTGSFKTGTEQGQSPYPFRSFEWRQAGGRSVGLAKPLTAYYCVTTMYDGVSYVVDDQGECSRRNLSDLDRISTVKTVVDLLDLDDRSAGLGFILSCGLLYSGTCGYFTSHNR